MSDESIILMTIRQYSLSRGVSYEAVRRQTIRYSKELNGHIHKQGKKNFLDEYAINFLDEHRQPKSIVIANDDKAIQQEREQYLQTIDTLRSKIESLQDTIINLQSESRALIEEKTKATTYLESHKLIEDDLRQQLEDAKQEIQSYKKSFFGFYRKS